MSNNLNLRAIVADMQKELRASNALDNPTWCNWYVLKSVPIPDDDEEGTIDLAVNPCKRKDAFDGHLYYSVDSIVGMDYTNLGEPVWYDTEDCKSSSLRKVLQDLLDVMTDKEMLSMYRDYVRRVGA